MVPNHALDTFHSYLMDDVEWQEHTMRVALKVVKSYMAPGEEMTDADYDLAHELMCRVSIA